MGFKKIIKLVYKALVLCGFLFLWFIFAYTTLDRSNGQTNITWPSVLLLFVLLVIFFRRTIWKVIKDPWNDLSVFLSILVLSFEFFVPQSAPYYKIVVSVGQYIFSIILLVVIIKKRKLFLASLLLTLVGAFFLLGQQFLTDRIAGAIFLGFGIIYLLVVGSHLFATVVSRAKQMVPTVTTVLMVVCILAGAIVFARTTLQFKPTPKAIEESALPLSASSILWEANKIRLVDAKLDQLNPDEKLTQVAEILIANVPISNDQINTNFESALKVEGVGNVESAKIVIVDGFASNSEAAQMVKVNTNTKDCILSAIYSSAGVAYKIVNGRSYAVLICAKLKTVKGTGQQGTPQQNRPTDDSPWGVQKQVDDVTWTMKVGMDERMATPNEIYEALNNYRLKYGRSRLQWDNNLANFANTRTAAFVKLGDIDKHAGFMEFAKDYNNVRSLGFNRINENISYGYRLSGVHIIEWAYSDKPHDDNQLNPDWNYVGISVNGTATALEFGAK